MESLLVDAEKLEEAFDWLGAAGSYEKALSLRSDQDLARKGQLREGLGYALFRAALQADSRDEFLERLKQARENYQNAQDFYEKSEARSMQGFALRCSAMRPYIGYWLASDVQEKKSSLEDSWRQAKETLKNFQTAGDFLEYLKTANQLLAAPNILQSYASDFQTLRGLMQENLDYAEGSIKLAARLRASGDLSRAYVIASGIMEMYGLLVVPDQDERVRYRKESEAHWSKAKELSEDAAILQLVDFPSGPLLGFGEGSDRAITIFKAALERARKSRDRLAIGFSLETLGFHTFWKSIGCEDPEEAMLILKEALDYAVEAKREYSTIRYASRGLGVLWVGAPRVEYYWELASLQTDMEKRRELLEKAIETVPAMLKAAEESGYPYTLSSAHHVVSKAFESLAQIEKKTETKRSLLEEALKYRRKNMKLQEELFPYYYWDLGVFYNYLSEIDQELSRITDEPASRKLLEDAVQAKERCLDFVERSLPMIESTSAIPQFRWIGSGHFEFGNLLFSLYKSTGDREDLRRAAEAFERAAEMYRKTTGATWVAEACWKAAQTYDALKEHSKSGERFAEASQNYRAAAQKLPQLRDFYQDYAAYMEGWSEIEQARQQHSRQEYGSAEELYQKAADLQRSTKRWSTFFANYSALAKIEKGEKLSREELSEDATNAFHDGARLFRESKRSLQSAAHLGEESEESQMATQLIQAADGREEYCKARVLIEEGKIIGRKGDHDSSSAKYGEAARLLERIAAATPEQDRREIKLIMILSKAWEAMASAESKASAGLYGEAAKFFDEARELTVNQKERMLIQGHSHFCRALGAETEFTDTRKDTLREEAIQHLQTASDYYLKAGFRSDSESTKATKLLLDAHVYMEGANREAAPEKKAKLYLMAEKVLEASAKSYEKAGQTARRDHVAMLLEMVREEKELAVSLTEVMQAPSVLSTTAAFSTPTPSFERPVGLERFERADIQSHIVAGRRSLKVGENLDFEVELVNAGKGFAQLVKMEDVVPEGFEVVQRPDAYRLEENSLILKGKRLDSLKTEELRLVARSKARGSFTLKPRILYLDENGNYKSHESEPVEITVKELGVSGWLRGSS